MTQQPEYIGCMDGRAIILRRQADEIVLTFDGAEARLSIEAAIRLANFLPSVTPSSRSSDDKPRFVQPLKRRGRYRETIADLIEEGLLSVGEVLTISHYGMDHFATITEDGKFNIDGHKEKSPSGAGERVIGRPCSGWKLWKTKDGNTLAVLRWMLRAKQFPGEKHGYAVSTARDKQVIATGWVDYALARGLDPGKKDNTKTEAFLADRQLKSDYRYTESTLNVYRGHLRQWFERCREKNWRNNP